MIVGCPKEIKPNEYRVGIIPESAAEFLKHGHQVLIETSAGEGIGASDQSYRDRGAEIVLDAACIFEKADMIVKVKELQARELELLRENQILYAFLHLAPDPEQTQGLLASGCTAVAYETITGPAGDLPLLTPMSEIAGRLSIQAAARCLEKTVDGPGLLLGGVPGVRAAKVIIIGGGIVGMNAARMAIGLGADVAIVDQSLPQLRKLDNMFGGRLHTYYSTEATIRDLVESADVIIGAALIPGASAPKLLSRSALSSMKKGSILVDVSIDQGGCFETSRPTTHVDPTYKIDDVIHYCVANMPGAVPQTANLALAHATLPMGLKLADSGLAAFDDPHLLAGLNVHHGQLTHSAVAHSIGGQYVDPHIALQTS